MEFGREVKVVLPAPEVAAADVMTQTEAVEVLGVAQQTVLNRVNAGRFTVIWRLAGTEYGSARLLLRSEVDEFAAGSRSPGGRLALQAPPFLRGSRPVMDGCKFGREVRMLEQLDVDVDAVMSQRDACEVLAMEWSLLTRQLNNGRFTTVWDLRDDVAGGSRGSRRKLLVSEVRDAAAGGRRRKTVNYRQLPG